MLQGVAPLPLPWSTNPALGSPHLPHLGLTTHPPYPRPGHKFRFENTNIPMSMNHAASL